jgi:hypothetical protein
VFHCVLTDTQEHQPGTTAPTTGHYRLLNVMGKPTQHSIHGRRGEPLPAAPRGNGWRLEQETDEDE